MGSTSIGVDGGDVNPAHCTRCLERVAIADRVIERLVKRDSGDRIGRRVPLPIGAAGVVVEGNRDGTLCV